jgi:hypothetical protein
VRFVCFELVEGQRNRLGLFNALELAEEADHAPGWALAELKAVNDWFTDQLAVPDRFARGGGWGRPGQQALSWFKATAEEHVRQMHRLKVALEECGVHVEVLTTRDPGHILYEDDHQVAAEPLGNRF